MISIPVNIKILIPCYNGGKSAYDFLKCVEQQLPKDQVLLVNDGSKLEFVEFLKSLDLPLLDFSENRGKGAVLKDGLEEGWESADWVITMDCDGQHPLESLPDFVKKLAEISPGVLIGARPFRLGEMPWARVFSNRVSTKMVEGIAKTKVWDAQSGFRAYHKELGQKKLLPQPSRFQWESEVLIHAARSGLAVSKVEIPAIYGEEASHIDHFGDTMRFLKMLRRVKSEWKGK